MTNTISSRTPEGVPNRCPICGTLLWFFHTSAGMRFYESKAVAPIRDKVVQIICDNLGVNIEQVTSKTSFLEDVEADSLDVVELVMELEETFGVTIPKEDAEKIKTVGDAIDYLGRGNL
jgi:acyl carrier protein